MRSSYPSDGAGVSWSARGWLLLPRRSARCEAELQRRRTAPLLKSAPPCSERWCRRVAARLNPELLACWRPASPGWRPCLAADAGNDYAETAYRLMILCARQQATAACKRMLTALSLQTLRYSKLGHSSVERRQRSARLWREATTALAQGDIRAHGRADAPHRGIGRRKPSDSSAWSAPRETNHEPHTPPPGRWPA